MRTFSAAPFSADPARNVIPPPNIDHFLPKAFVTLEAKKEEINAARYNDEVNEVSNWLSNLQYWFVLMSSFSFRYTDGKNLSKKESIDVTPPAGTKTKSEIVN